MFTEFEDIIRRELKRLSIRFELNENAPNSFEHLKRECTERHLIVWPGGSEQTIYGAANTNYMFRAWHDSLHLRLNAPFTLDGETHVARTQAASVGDLAGRIILAEVQGQAEYFAAHGEFPADQLTFVLNYLKGVKS